jgi:hypothetical protein
MGSMALQLRPFTVPDASEVFGRALTLRDMMDQRRYRQLQQQSLEQKIEEDREQMRQARSLSDLFRANPEPTAQEIMTAAPGVLGFKTMAEQRQAQTAGTQARTAALTQEKTQGELTQFKRKLATNKAASILREPDRARREQLWAVHVPELIDLEMLTPELRAQPLDENLVARFYIEAEGQEAYDKLIQSRQEAARKADEAAFKASLRPYEAREAVAKTETAQQIATGTQPQPETGTLREFRQVFYPGYLKEHGITRPTAANEIAAYREFRELLRSRIEVPGVDVPLPPAVAEQRVKMSKATQAEKPPTEGERRALGFYERMKNAEEAMSTIEEALGKMSTFDQIRLKSAPDWAQTKEGQLYWQAVRQFTEARLRKESGAAIGQSEFDYSEKTFFRQPNDDPATVARKKAARKVLMDSARRESGRAYTQAYGEEEAPAAPAAPAGTHPKGSDPGGIR